MKPLRFHYERADARGLVHFLGGATEDRRSAIRLQVFTASRLIVGVSLIIKGLKDHDVGGILVGVFFALWGMVSGYVTFRIELTIRRFGKVLSETPEIQISDSDEGILWEVGGNTGLIAWAEIERFGEDDNAIYVRIKDNCLAIPKRAFSTVDDAKAFYDVIDRRFPDSTTTIEVAFVSDSVDAAQILLYLGGDALRNRRRLYFSVLLVVIGIGVWALCFALARASSLPMPVSLTLVTIGIVLPVCSGVLFTVQGWVYANYYSFARDFVKQGAQRVSFTNSAIEWQSNRESRSFEWRSVRQVDEDRHGLYLYVEDSWRILPRRAFRSRNEIAALHRLIRTRTVGAISPDRSRDAAIWPPPPSPIQ